MRNRKRNVRAGFTLTELMIVVAITGVVGATAFPLVNRQLDTIRIDRSVSQVASFLREAREDAAKRKVEVEVVCGNHGNFVYKRGDYDGNGSIGFGETDVEYINTTPGVTWTTPLGWSSFSARGTFVSSSGTWELRLSSHDGRQQYVYVLPTGQIIQSRTRITMPTI